MKKLYLAVVAMLPLLAMAADYSTIYNQCPQVTGAQMLDAAFVEKSLNLYKQLEAQNEAEYQRINASLSAVQSAPRPKQPQMSASQKQATMAAGKDMMAALQAAGITPDKLAQMSEEEIMAIAMSVVAQKSGLTTEEMQAMAGMSDKQAEAYVKGNKDRMNRMQNSDFAQYGIQEMDGPSVNEADYDKWQRIQQLIEQIQISYNEREIMVLEGQLNEFHSKELEQYRPYEDRVSVIEHELYGKVDAISQGTAIKTPAFAQSYFDRMNAVADEYNRMAIPQWDKLFTATLAKLRSDLQKNLPIYMESMDLYNSITDPYVKSMAAPLVANPAVYRLLMQYIDLQTKRLEGRPYYHYSVPEMMGGMG
ncbi:MAG: hypothetical protein MJZ82_03680 [Paludibacteraceae bacterium]|nr:hypothetical protein [Paludibacteraceae bacterium]